MFVTLKPSVFDPQGTTVAEALHTLGYATVKRRPPGQYFELEIDAPSADEGAPPRVGSRRQAARQSGDRELSHRGARREIRRRRLPRIQLRPRRVSRAKHVLGQDAEFVWHKDTSLGGADVVILPAGLRTATTCAPARSRGSRRSCRRSRRSPPPAARCSASATASRCCSRPVCCRARCCGTAACSSAASTCT